MKKTDALYAFVNGLVFCGVGRRVTPFAPENDVRRHHYRSRTPALMRAGRLRMGMDVVMRTNSSERRKFTRTTNLRNPGLDWVRGFNSPHYPRFLTISASVQPGHRE